MRFSVLQTTVLFPLLWKHINSWSTRNVRIYQFPKIALFSTSNHSYVSTNVETYSFL